MHGRRCAVGDVEDRTCNVTVITLMDIMVILTEVMGIMGIRMGTIMGTMGEIMGTMGEIPGSVGGEINGIIIQVNGGMGEMDNKGREIPDKLTCRETRPRVRSETMYLHSF